MTSTTEQLAELLNNALRAGQPRAYLPTGHVRDRIVRRMRSMLGASSPSDPRALRILAALDSGGTVSLWKDNVTAPHISVVEECPDGGATLWSVRPEVGGCVYLDSGWRYWPDPAHDHDIPNIPMMLGVDDWCLAF